MKTLANAITETLNMTAEAMRPLTTGATPPPPPGTTARPSSPAAGPAVKPPHEPTLKDSPEAQDELTRLLYQTFASQKTYGDKGQMMEYRDGMFQLVLADYPLSAVRKAFIEHVSRKPDLPSPSDIVNLIDPPPQPLSAAVYVNLQKRSREGVYLYGDEREYCRAFEAQEMAKARGGSDDLREAQRQIVEHERTLAIGFDDSNHD